MTRPEDRLRAALDARAATAQPAPDALARIRDRVGRRRRAGVLVGATAAAAVVGGVAYAALLVDHDRPARVVTPVTSETPSPDASPSPDPSPSPSASPSSTDAAETAAAISHDRRVVLVSARTGAVLRVLYQPRGVELDGEVAFSPDRRWVYFTVRDPGSGCATVRRVPATGGPDTWVAPGSDPVVSPDGTRVAVRGSVCQDSYDLVVVDVRTGDMRTYPHDGIEIQNEGVPHQLAWQDDDHLLVLLTWEEGVSSIRRLAVDEDDRLVEAERMPWAGWESAYALAVGRAGTPLIARNDWDGSPETEVTAVWVDRVDRETGAVTRLFDVPGRSLRALSVDPRGVVLYVGEDGSLWRWYGDPRPVRVGGDVLSVDW